VTALRGHPKARSGTTAEAVAAADRADLSWTQRLALLREHVLGQVPLLLVLDNFDDNLSLEAGTCTIRDPSLIELLTSWADPPHRGRLLITCRHRFAVPGAAAPWLGFRHLGPLSRSGAVELARSLPALGLLGGPDLDRAWRLLGGHPRAMEYLDALLMAGDVRFPAVAARLGADPGLPAARLAAPTELPLPTAEAGALAVADVLLGDLFASLSEQAQGLLIRASVYRAPIGRDVLLLPVGQYSPAELGRLLDECRATGLLAADPAEDPPSVFVHRWTAFELHRRLADRQRGAEVTDAHRHAAEYWRWRISGWPHDHRAQSEAGYHLLQVSELSRQAPAEGRHRSRPRRRRWPFAAGALAVVTVLAAGAGGAVFARPAATSSPAASSPVASARAQAAAWVAVQASGDTIVACDPAMCAALLARGVPAGNMLILRSESSDPLGSDIRSWPRTWPPGGRPGVSCWGTPGSARRRRPGPRWRAGSPTRACSSRWPPWPRPVPSGSNRSAIPARTPPRARRCAPPSWRRPARPRPPRPGSGTCSRSCARSARRTWPDGRASAVARTARRC